MKERTDEKPEAEGRKELDFQAQGQRILVRVWKSTKATWKIYRGSKTGLAGLAIVLGFLLMAAFAPFIAPYGPDFRAPSVDTFIADSANRDLGADLNWTKTMGLVASWPSTEKALERILVYSSEGVAKVFPVSPGLEQKIFVGTPVTAFLPQNASYMEYARFGNSLFLIMNTTYEPDTGNYTTKLFEYTYGLAFDSEHVLPFQPKYHSNLWDGYSPTLNTMRLDIAFADDHNVWLLTKRPYSIYDPVVRTFENLLSIDNATIVGNPLVVDGTFGLSNLLVVPTDAGLRCYRLNITTTNVTKIVTDVKIGDLLWDVNYSVENETFEPVTGENMITFPYPYGAVDESGKKVIVLGTSDGRVVAYYRVNGTIAWANKLIMPSIRDFQIDGVYPSPQVVVVAGKAGTRTMLAGVEPKTGVIWNNQTAYTSVEGYLNSDPQYVEGQKMFVFSTDIQTIYLVSDVMRLNATFGVTGGGMKTPVSYLGNIYISTSIAGNYFGAVQMNNSVFIETLSGVNIAPLPPGTYPSGNRYILGTDYEGHDILTWIVYGTRSELMVGITAAFFSVVIGTIVGLVAGFYAGFIDDLLMRTTDVVLSLPYLVIMLLFAAVFGPSLYNIIIIIAILSWAGIARVIRSVTLSIKERAFVDAAIVAGASQSRLIFRHIGPNVLPYAFLYMAFGISGAIVTEAILAFLGFGDVNHITWGMMLQYLQISGHALDAPWWLLPPGICITLISLAFYLIGRAFDEVVNPRLRKR